jgi:hypothetical protein
LRKFNQYQVLIKNLKKNKRFKKNSKTSSIQVQIFLEIDVFRILLKKMYFFFLNSFKNLFLFFQSFHFSILFKKIEKTKKFFKKYKNGNCLKDFFFFFKVKNRKA